MPSYNLKYMRAGSSKEKNREWVNTPCKKVEELYIKEFTNTTFLPRIPSNRPGDSWMGYGGIIDAEGKWISESGVYRCNGIRVFGGDYDIADRKINEDLSDETVIYMGPYFPHWGHFLLDHMARLWYAMEHTEELIVFTGWNENKQGIQGNFAKLIKLLGIDIKRFINIQEPTLLGRVIIPQPAFERGTYFSEKFNLMTHKVVSSVSNLGLRPYEKIYFSRAKFAKKNNREYGNENLDKFWEKNGYKVFYPEELSAEEQIYYVSHCKEFVVVPGGASMNALFLSAYAKVIYLQKEDTDVEINDLYQINEMKLVSEVTYISVYYKCKLYAKLLPRCRDKFWVGVTEELIDFAEEHSLEVPENTRLVYFKKKYDVAQIKYAILGVRLRKVRARVAMLLRKLPLFNKYRD